VCVCVCVCVCVRARVRVHCHNENTHTYANTFVAPCLKRAMNWISGPPLSLTRQRTAFKLRTTFSSYFTGNKVREHYKDNVFINNQYSVWDYYQTNIQHGQKFSFWRLLLVAHTVTTGNTAILETRNPCSLHFRGGAKVLTALILGHALPNLQSTAWCQWATHISNSNRKNGKHVKMLWTCSTHGLSQYWPSRRKEEHDIQWRTT
jgi:hypothetical protein